MKSRFLTLILFGLLVIAFGACDERAPVDPDTGSPILEGTDGDLPEGRVQANRHREKIGDFQRGEEGSDGVNVVAAGTGLFDQPGTFTIDVPVGSDEDILEAWLYWTGRSLYPVSDETLVINGDEHTGTLLASFEHSVSPSRFAFLYRLDAIDLVAAGTNTFEVSGFDMGILGRPNGVGLVVVYRDADGYAEVQMLELADFFYWADIDAGNSGVHSFAFGASEEARDANLMLFVGDGEADRPDALWMTAGEGEGPTEDIIGSPDATDIPDVLTSNVGDQYDIVRVEGWEIPAGAEHVAFQIESPGDGLDGDSGILSLAVLCLGGDVVENAAPRCDAGGGYEGAPGDELEFDGSGSNDSDGEIVSWTWDFGDGSTGDGEITTHAYERAGEYTVSLCVVDDGGLESCCETSAVVNAGEIVCDAGGPYEGTAGEEISFDGSGSVDPDGVVEAYLWDFGDGTQGEGITTTHAYAESGDYAVALCLLLTPPAADPARGEGGEMICCETQASVAPRPNESPDCLIGQIFGGKIYAGDLVAFDGTGSSDPDGEVVAWEWDFDDGTTASGAEVTHAWETGGTYTVTLCVTDDDEAESCCEVELEILDLPNQAPVCEIGILTPGSVIVLGQHIQVAGYDSYDLDGTIVSYSFDFGDGSDPVEGDVANHTYTETGSYTITLTVTDDDDESSSCAVDVEVVPDENLAPDCDAGGLYKGLFGEPVTFDGSGSSDEDGDIVSWFWDFGDGATGSGETTEHTYTLARGRIGYGSFEVSLTVTDDDGAQSDCTTEVLLFVGGDGRTRARFDEDR